jgi:hypothetical protein
LVNLTDFAAETSLRMDSDGREVLSVVVKGTFRLTASAQLLQAEEQSPLRGGDVYWGDPAATSLAGASDMVLFKPATDILISGCCYPNQRDPNWNFAGFRFGPQKMRKLVQVFGDRRWEKRLVGMGVSQPARFEKIPIVYERAFGGVDDSVPGIVDACPENPVGMGFRGKRSRKEIAGQSVANLEDPQHPIAAPDQRPRPHALGPIGPAWSPRSSFAGTYDQAWSKDRMPLPPVDFDPRYNQAAPPDQIYPGYLVGGEPMEIYGMAPEGYLRFEVPRVRPQVVVRVLERRETPTVACDTIEVDMEKRAVSLTWRAHLDVQGQVDGIHWIKVEL